MVMTPMSLWNELRAILLALLALGWVVPLLLAIALRSQRMASLASHSWSDFGERLARGALEAQLFLVASGWLALALVAWAVRVALVSPQR